MEEPIVKTSDLGKKYGGRYAVQDLDVEIRRGQIYGLIWQNGAGKTTFIRMLTGLIAPTEGQIELFGESGERGLQKARCRIGSIVETPALYPGMTARQNLESQARLLGLANNAAVIGEALELAGLVFASQSPYSPCKTVAYSRNVMCNTYQKLTKKP
jgi:ABC-2 type transport system ATP-binding protein